MIRQQDRKGHGSRDDRKNGKSKSLVPSPQPLSQIKNSPSAAPPPTFQQMLCRKRRTSDLLLLLIGSAACLLSVTHILWHSESLPHVHRHNAGESSHEHTKNNSALKTHLDGFANAKRRKKATKGRRVPSREDGAQKKRVSTVGARDESVDEEPHPTKTSPKEKTGENAARKRRASAGDPSRPPAPRARPHPVAHLDCADHGGPADPRAMDEMVFWSDIPADASYLSPMHPLNDPYAPDDAERFLTFEPDSGGWNNVRMAMETALVLSHATGRTLVLPPEQRVYLLNKGAGDDRFSFEDFFHLDAISIEHRGFKVITMEEFLVRVAKEGRLKHPVTQRTVYPPGNQTDWGGGGGKGGSRDLFRYLRSVGNTPEWDPWECALAIPSSTEPESIDDLNRTLRFIMQGSDGKSKPTLDEFNGHPTPVNATMRERMREMLADRNKLCIYDKPLRESALLHLKVEKGVRLLTHFYAFVFFADWRQDLWSKRFVRDHLRYVDEIVCAAARVVEAVRERSRENARKNNDNYNIDNSSNNNASRSRADDDDGVYDAMHVRRGDFQYPPTQLPADKLYDLSKGELEEGATLYVATDERNKGFFDIFKKHFDVVFLDDFASKVIPDVNPNYYGMIDQLVAYKSRVFYGTWWSTLSGYVNRMRGYYIAKHKLDGYKDGTMRSWYFTPEERVLQMRSYIPVRKPIYCREFPTSWRDIDNGIDEIQ